MDRYDDEHLEHFFALELVDAGYKTREQQRAEIAANMGFTVK